LYFLTQKGSRQLTVDSGSRADSLQLTADSETPKKTFNSQNRRIQGRGCVAGGSGADSLELTAKEKAVQEFKEEGSLAQGRVGLRRSELTAYS
jgi:hypothetical protein